MFDLSVDRAPVRTHARGKPPIAAAINGVRVLSNRGNPQRRHILMLETLAATPGYVSYRLLARHIGCRAPDPARALAVYAAALRRYLKPHGFGIRNSRTLGYMLCRLM